MQNPNVKYLREQNGSFALFSLEHNRIWCRRQTESAWSAPYCIAEGATAFSLCRYEDFTYLLYSTTDGRLQLAASADLLQWEQRPLWQEGQSRWQPTASFFLLPQKDAVHIIYPQLQAQNGSASLLYTYFQKGQWHTPYQIDHFLPWNGTPFLGRRLGENHAILYYRSHRNIISARELLLAPFTIGSLSPLIQTGDTCVDFSILEDEDRLHLLYIVRSLFRTQVIYRYKQTAAISRPQVIWDGVNCDTCWLYREQNHLILFWTVNGQPMRCVCDNGVSFGPIERYTAPFPMQPMKAELVQAWDSRFTASEYIGDRQNGALPMLFPATASEPVQQLQAASTDTTITSDFSSDSTERKDELEELRCLLAQRSEELSAVNARWKAQVDALQQQLQLLQDTQSLESSAPEEPTS